MQIGTKAKQHFVFVRRRGTVLFCALFLSVWTSVDARAEIKDNHSFRSIEWENDFVRSQSLSMSAFRLFPGAQIVPLSERKLSSAYGLQLGQKLRDHWSGRVSFFCGSTGGAADDLIWSYLASDLHHPLIPESLYQTGVFKFFRPNIFFGLGVTTRWQKTRMSLNFIPTLRYEFSEPIAVAGTQWLFSLSDEFMLGFEYRFSQSAQESRHRGGLIGASLVWGSLEKN
jgi:hypothetical protein